MFYIDSIELMDGDKSSFLSAVYEKYQVVVIHLDNRAPGSNPRCFAIGEKENLLEWLYSDEDGYGANLDKLLDYGIELKEETSRVDKFIKLIFEKGKFE